MSTMQTNGALLDGATPADGFDFSAMDSGGLKGRIAKWLLGEPQWWMGLMRRYWPIARLPGGWAVVTRY